MEAALHRPVNPNLMTPAEWQRKRAEGSPFVVKVAQQPKIFVYGTDDDLA